MSLLCGSVCVTSLISISMKGVKVTHTCVETTLLKKSSDISITSSIFPVSTNSRCVRQEIKYGKILYVEICTFPRLCALFNFNGQCAIKRLKIT
jgi:hypothetical protein